MIHYRGLTVFTQKRTGRTGSYFSAPTKKKSQKIQSSHRLVRATHCMANSVSVLSVSSVRSRNEPICTVACTSHGHGTSMMEAPFAQEELKRGRENLIYDDNRAVYNALFEGRQTGT